MTTEIFIGVRIISEHAVFNVADLPYPPRMPTQLPPPGSRQHRADRHDAHVGNHAHGHSDEHSHALGRPPAPSAHHHGHDHAHTGNGGKLLGIAFALTSSFMLVELIGALLAGSLALMADAGHMLTDAGALALAWAAIRIAARRPDARRSFGYQRLRVLATFVNGCALLFIVAWIAVEAVQRLVQPTAVDGATILWIGGLGFLVNLGVFAMLRRGDALDMNIAAATLHVIGDLLGSVAAVVAGVVILWTGWEPIDPLLSLLVCTLIVRSAWALIRRSTHILMEGAPDWLDPHELRSTLERHVPAIREVHHVHCWQVGPNETLLTMHALVAGGVDHSAVLREANAVLAEKFGIAHATIQIEVDECMDAGCEPAAPAAVIDKRGSASR
jgi:cobalt-zinc-cadmium efflux system protein